PRRAGCVPRQFSAVLLAGGHSRRMGRDKALLEIGGRTLLDHQLATLAELGAGEILLSCRAGQDLAPRNARMVHDRHGDCGPLGAVASCLAAACSDRIVVLAVDMPAMTPGFLQRLLAHGPESVIPARADGFFEPLAAVYSRGLLPSALQSLQRGEFSMRAWIRPALAQGLAATYPIAPEEESLFANWNTPA
ncbi:MAG TPA: molybdenum cofactor guanylyltransferase, partial [Terrimicrobiaceae bacterium]|nr:molybdenum cofactor guanylyltransferase [Terrimicrobiaceae bacterium]